MATTTPTPGPRTRARCRRRIRIEAARWHKQAAEAGDAEAQYRYGMLLKQGRTDAPDGPEQALVWLRKAAKQGHAQANEALPR